MFEQALAVALAMNKGKTMYCISLPVSLSTDLTLSRQACLGSLGSHANLL